MFSIVLRADDHLFTLPVLGDDVVITSAWYYPLGPPFYGADHFAIDYSSNLGASFFEGREILAALGGIVIHVTNDVANGLGEGWGNYVKIDHGNGYETLDAHCLFGSIPVNVGDCVYQGQVIGQVGNTGSSTNFHLHHQTYLNGVPIDPYGWYDYASTPNTYPNCNPDEYYWTNNPPVGPPNVNTERQLPDDLLVHVIGTPDYYWLQDGLMRGFDSEYPFYTWGLEWDDAVEISNEEFTNFQSGSNIEVMPGACVFDENYQRWVFDYASDTSPTIVKRKATNWQFLGYADNVWIPVSNNFMTQFNEGLELLSTSGYPYGTVFEDMYSPWNKYVLVKGDSYGMSGQKVKLSLFSDNAYNINYYHYNFRIIVPLTILNSYPTVSGTYEFIRDGELVQSFGSVYYLENCHKRKIVDDISFDYYGFDYSNVNSVSDSDINAFPDGVDISFSPSGGPGVYNGGELDDGGFDSGLEAYWNFFDWQGVADFEVTSENQVSGIYKAEADVYSSSNYYDVEIKQLVNVESNETYHCSFYAKSDNPMMIKFNLGKDTSPWENYGLWKEITTESDWRKYQYIFNCTETDALARLSFQIGEISGHLYLDEVTFEKVEEMIPPDENLLSNGDFESGHYAPWQMGDINGVADYYTDTFEIYDGQYSMFIDPNQSEEHFQVQLEQLVDVQAEETYYVSFYAKAEESRSLFLELYHNGPPWTNYGLWSEVEIETDWALYEVEFISTNTGTDRFTMHFGHQDVGIWIDDISITTSRINIKEEEDDTETSEISLFQNHPNPFNPETCINYSISDPNSELVIYNIRGQVVKNYNLSPGRNSVIWSGLNNSNKKVSTGIYLYVIKSGNQMTQMRKMILMK